MKTADLIDLLARDASPTPAGVVNRRLLTALAVGGAVTFAVVALWLRCQPLVAASQQPWFWMKLVYTGLLTGVGVVVVRRLSAPGGGLEAAPWAGLAVVLAMAALGVGQLLMAAPAARAGLWLGETWRLCSPLILLLALPIFGCLVAALRTLAPTRLTATGAAAGYAAGALAATLYGLHCPEQGAAFVLTWYSLGIAAATALGALTGPRLLRW